MRLLFKILLLAIFVTSCQPPGQRNVIYSQNLLDQADVIIENRQFSLAQEKMAIFIISTSGICSAVIGCSGLSASTATAGVANVEIMKMAQKCYLELNHAAKH